jgi:hypothetical protein
MPGAYQANGCRRTGFAFQPSCALERSDASRMYVDARVAHHGLSRVCRSVCDEVRGYSVVAGEPPVVSAPMADSNREPRGAQSSHRDSWLATMTMTEVGSESDDTDSPPTAA